MAEAIEGIDSGGRLGARARPLFVGALIAGLVGVALALATTFGMAVDAPARRFFLAYLNGFMFCLSLSLGALFFVMIHHVCRAGWSVAIRRVAELMAYSVVWGVVLFVPLLLAVVLGDDLIYRWTGPAEGDALLAGKKPYLTRWAFIVRVVAYFAIWVALAWFLLKRSVAQDERADPQLSLSMEKVSGPGLLLFALTITWAALDLIMSLDYSWYSTIFGVYYFTGGVGAFFAVAILFGLYLERRGVLAGVLTTEHYHDLGKFLFGFVFFWGYIAFSQYMLIWYGNIPEETHWLVNRGLSTHADHATAWSYVAVALLVGRFLVPFPALLSRHVKRYRPSLVFWATWILVFHAVDMTWLIMPAWQGGWEDVAFGLPELGGLVGVSGLWLAGLVAIARHHALIPVRDPRLAESLSLDSG